MWPCGLVLIAQKIYLQMLRDSIFHSILIHVYLSNLKQNLVRHNFVLRNRSASLIFHCLCQEFNRCHCQLSCLTWDE